MKLALRTLTRDAVPIDWAETQCELGRAMGELADRTSDQQMSAEAIARWKASLEVITREILPLSWGQNNKRRA